MRGKLSNYKPTKKAERITPAHAGKTKNRARARLGNRDHPRACGENLEILFSQSGVVGSPPRMRGKPKAPQATGDAVGITPAHAGKTSSARKCSAACRDHPRACGENEPPASTASMRLGITPAHAGKTYCKTVFPANPKDHPRACGENRQQFHVLSYL